MGVLGGQLLVQGAQARPVVPQHPVALWQAAEKRECRPVLGLIGPVEADVGDVLLWESWLRHEVPMNMSEEDRISVSFNYGWA